jgi:hypothetical protein
MGQYQSALQFVESWNEISIENGSRHSFNVARIGRRIDVSPFFLSHIKTNKGRRDGVPLTLPAYFISLNGY